MGGGGSTYDYGFRIYNPALGKFLSVDPLVKNYAYYSPYHFAGNRPIWAIDLDGREDEWYYKAWESVNSGKTKVIINGANHIAENMANSVVLVGSSVILPVVRQGYIISQEGIHEGDAYDSKNIPTWAVPYQIQSWSFVPQKQMMGEVSYEDGKVLMNSTVNVIALFVPVTAPIKVGSPLLKKGLDFTASLAVKTSVKLAIKTGLNAIEESPATNENVSNSKTISTTNSSNSKSYTIRSGDTLTGIAKQNGTTVDSIAKQNNISDVNKIKAGETLNIN